MNPLKVFITVMSLGAIGYGIQESIADTSNSIVPAIIFGIGVIGLLYMITERQ